MDANLLEFFSDDIQMEKTMHNAMQRTADPRVYANAAKQSIQPSKYFTSDIKYTHCEKLDTIEFQTIDKPCVSVPRFDKNDLAYCSWVPS
jgi:hypothetical protein